MLPQNITALGGRQAKILGNEHAKNSAVLLPLISVDNELQVLFEKRSSKINSQPAEICFPGGGRDEQDGSARNTAIRECCEELGITTDNIEVIADLDIMVSPLNVIVEPFLAYIKDHTLIKANPDEVEYIFTVPLDFFIKSPPKSSHISLEMIFPDDYPFELIQNGKDYPFKAGIFPQYFYEWNQEVIWGLTARILRHFIELIGGEPLTGGEHD